MLRVRLRVPPEPHESEHELHSPHASGSQSTGHGCVLHGWLSVRAPQTLPPYAGGWTTMRVWFLMPPPHVAEHVPYGNHFDTTQSTGHGCELHSTTCSLAGQAVPSCCASTWIVRERVLVPRPQVRSQFPQLCHCENEQSTGQAPAWHGAGWDPRVVGKQGSG